MELSKLDIANTTARPRYDREAGALVGSRCERCLATSWPGRAVCHRCGYAPTSITSFARTGTMLSYTTVWVARPGVTPPFTLAQVKLDDGPIIVGHARELPEGTRVPLHVVLVLGKDPEMTPLFWFEPAPDVPHADGSWPAQSG